MSKSCLCNLQTNALLKQLRLKDKSTFEVSNGCFDKFGKPDRQQCWSLTSMSLIVITLIVLTKHLFTNCTDKICSLRVYFPFCLSQINTRERKEEKGDIAEEIEQPLSSVQIPQQAKMPRQRSKGSLTISQHFVKCLIFPIYWTVLLKAFRFIFFMTAEYNFLVSVDKMAR